MAWPNESLLAKVSGRNSGHWVVLRRIATGLDFGLCWTHNPIMTTKALTHKSFDAATALTVVRLTLQGALLGVAIVGIFTQAQHYDVAGAIAGGLIVLIAKLKHFF